MKTINKWALGIALMAGLASCEMKDELLGDSVLSGDTGFLALNVATANVSTKGTTDQVDEFPVTIKGKDVEYTKTYDSYAELKKEESIELPVGTFTIEAHSPVEFEDVMSEPYYGGTKDITITKGVTSEEEVQCKIQNVKITMSYTAAFLETYESWTITVNDKKGHVEVFTNEDGTEPASVYWKLDGTVETIYIEGKAVNKTTKEEVSIYGTAKKTNLPGYEDDDDTAFVGGDELKIEANPVQVEGSTPGVEKEGIEMCRLLGRDDAKLVLDPTLLLSKSDYDEIRSDEEFSVKKRYLLVYSLNNSLKIYREAHKLAERNGLRMVVLKRSICPPDISRFKNAEELFAVSPAGFLNLIDGAECIITNSYHALLFAVNFHKPFYENIVFNVT